MRWWPSLPSIAFGALLGVGAACAPGPQEPERFVVDSFQPASGRAIHLNEPLALVFSEAPDPLTLSPASLAVTDGLGQPVAGEWTVNGRWARFWPKLPLTESLEDGGYRPGQVHRVEVLGFPSIGGVRTRSGRVLESTFRGSFEVQGPTEDADAGWEALLDFSPFECAPVEFSVLPGQGPGFVREGDPLRLFCQEPLDPRSLHAEDFRILRLPLISTQGQSAQEPYCGVRVILVRGQHEDRITQNEAAAEIHLLPQKPLVLDARAEYALEVRPGARLTDYAGHSPWPQVAAGERSELYRFRVRPLGAHDRNQVRLDFVDRTRLTSQPIPWVSGELTWEPGRLTLQCPRSAGDGQNGELGAAELSDARTSDWNGTSVGIEAGQGVRVESAGPWIVRSQTRWDLSGRLARTASSQEGMTPKAWYESHRGASAEDLIEAAISQNLPWTILAAAGDLVIAGELEVDTPLVLVAGGRVRITGSISAPAGEIYVVGDGGGRVPGQTLRYLPLRFAAPGTNPLRTTLSGALITSVLPSWVLDRYEWESVVILDDPGHGRVQVSVSACRWTHLARAPRESP